MRYHKPFVRNFFFNTKKTIFTGFSHNAKTSQIKQIIGNVCMSGCDLGSESSYSAYYVMDNNSSYSAYTGIFKAYPDSIDLTPTDEQYKEAFKNGVFAMGWHGKWFHGFQGVTGPQGAGGPIYSNYIGSTYLNFDGKPEEIKTPEVNNSMYPHKCNKCGSAAYIGFSSVSCSRIDCDNFKG